MTSGSTVIYFAYGSNMTTSRLQSRVPSAKALGRARLLGKRLVCDKQSIDESAKANLEPSPGDVVWGVLFQIDLSELGKLDRVEGGYERVEVEVLDEAGEPVTAHTYVARRVTTDPVPYEWYKQLIIAGAREHDLPKDYVAYLDSLASKLAPGRKTDHLC